MLSCFIVLSLASKCVFYRPKHNSKVGPHGTEFCLEKYNIPTDRAQRADKKNLVISLAMIFTPYGH